MEEVNHLISCQPTAIKAMRLQTLLPSYPKKIEVREMLGKDEVNFMVFFIVDAGGSTGIIAKIRKPNSLLSMKNIVTIPRNIFIIPNVRQCSNLLGGFSTRLITVRP